MTEIVDIRVTGAILVGLDINKNNVLMVDFSQLVAMQCTYPGIQMDFSFLNGTVVTVACQDAIIANSIFERYNEWSLGWVGEVQEAISEEGEPDNE